MKIIKICSLLALILLAGCDKSILDEKPKTFLNPETTYQTDAGLKAGSAGIYDIFIQPYFSNTTFERIYTVFNEATDVVQGGSSPSPSQFDQQNSDYSADGIFIKGTWDYFYILINNATLVINRSEKHQWANLADKSQTEGEARFFRAYAYFYLTQLWGDVPVVENEPGEIKTEFKRTPKAEVFKLIEADLKKAEEQLSYDQYNNQQGRITKGAVQHLLAYAYLAFDQNDNAIIYANKVINSGYYSLMTERFGSKSTDPKGNVFWDLFQLNNQNRINGNKEGILVIQNEDPALYPTVTPGDAIFAKPYHARQLYPTYWQKKGLAISTLYGGRGGGREATTLAWLNSFESSDTRGQMPNVQKVYVVNDPLNLPPGKQLGDTIYVYGNPAKSIYPQNDLALRPYPTKWNWEGTNSDNGSSTRDFYLFRLAETYLILAEAQYKKGASDLAKDNINKVRARAGASLISASQVTLDFILDERARELWGEVPRRVDLYRTGKYLERVKLYNPEAGPNVKDKHTLLPIPQAEIDLGTGTKMPQNPGWVNP